jgi:signal recognition particle subunit SEC65
MRIPITIPASSSPAHRFPYRYRFPGRTIPKRAAIDNDEDTDNDTGILLSAHRFPGRTIPKRAAIDNDEDTDNDTGILLSAHRFPGRTIPKRVAIDNDEDTDNDTGILLSGSSVSLSVSVSWSNGPQTGGHR